MFWNSKNSERASQFFHKSGGKIKLKQLNMIRVILIFCLLTNAAYLFSQNSGVPFNLHFYQSERFDDNVLIEILYNDSVLIYKNSTDQLEMPFIHHRTILTERGQYCLKTTIQATDIDGAMERKFYFTYNGNEEDIELNFYCKWDTISHKPLNLYRKNTVTVSKSVNGNPAGLKLKRLWKNPSPDGRKLRLPYEIYNPSNKLLYSLEENGVSFILQEYLSSGWEYLNCGGSMRLGKPFKPKQRYAIEKDGFVTGCDLEYLKGNEGSLRLKVQYHFKESNDTKRERIIDKKSLYTFSEFETFQFFDEFSVN